MYSLNNDDEVGCMTKQIGDVENSAWIARTASWVFSYLKQDTGVESAYITNKQEWNQNNMYTHLGYGSYLEQE